MTAIRSADPGSTVLLELVDRDGTTLGTAEKLSAHRTPGHLHRAFSVFLFDPAGRMLLQRRAESKYHSPGIWSNSCCGHPLPGEDPMAAAHRRIGQELGITATSLISAGTTIYRHTDHLTQLVEHEYNHLFVGTVDTAPQPDPDEVSSTSFVTSAGLRQALRHRPMSSWFMDVYRAARPTIQQAKFAPDW